MFARLLALTATTALLMSACATSQENPNYKYSTKYKGASPYSTQTTTTSKPVVQSAIYVRTQSASPITYQSSPYQTVQTAPASYSRTNHECLRKEKNRELLGSAVGGTLGAVVGKKTIGGTKGTVIGAGIGGVAGYGIGDKSVNCDPVVVQASQPMTTQQYQTAPTQYYPSSTTQPQPQPVQTYQPQPVQNLSTSTTYIYRSHGSGLRRNLRNPWLSRCDGGTSGPATRAAGPCSATNGSAILSTAPTCTDHSCAATCAYANVSTAANSYYGPGHNDTTARFTLTDRSLTTRLLKVILSTRFLKDSAWA